MTDRTFTIVVSRVLRGRGWIEHQDQASTDLRAQATARAVEEGLTSAHVGDVVVHPGTDGLWARLTCTASAHHHDEDDGATREAEVADRPAVTRSAPRNPRDDLGDEAGVDTGGAGRGTDRVG